MRRAEWRKGDPWTLHRLVTDAPDTFQVRCVLHYDDLVTGEDQAIVAFVEGWMVVEGHRTAFALRSTDVGRAGDGSLALAGGGWLRFEVTQRPAEFERALLDWCWNAEGPGGEPVFPPARVQPERLRQATLTGLTWALILVASLALALSGGPWILAVVGVALAAIGGLKAWEAGCLTHRLTTRDRQAAERGLNPCRDPR